LIVITGPNELRRLPSVDALLRHSELTDLQHALGHRAVANLARRVLDSARAAIAAGSGAPSLDSLIHEVAALAAPLVAGPLVPVINATGVVIHTNLGRAPLAPDAAAAALDLAQGYSNLEYDLDAGSRGSRDRHLEWLLTQVTGAEAGLAVNNNAAALLLALSALAAGREAIVSRGQAVEIGGGFRIPDVMRQSGSKCIAAISPSSASPMKWELRNSRGSLRNEVFALSTTSAVAVSSTQSSLDSPTNQWYKPALPPAPVSSAFPATSSSVGRRRG
jgi:hypothetical protein